MSSIITDPLKSTDTLTVALALSEKQLKIIENHQEMGDGKVADRLRKLRKLAWGEIDATTGKKLISKNSKTNFDDQKAEKFKEIMQGLEPSEKELLLSSYARMGYLYEIAAVTARANYLEKIKRDPRETIPGGVDALVKDNKNTPIKELIEKINTPEFEVVMTMHPTNVNSLASMKAQREIAKAIETRNEATLVAAITNYQTTPVLHQVANKKGEKHDANLTVRDETENVINFLGNIYEDMPRIYKQFDDALSKKATDANEKYDPTTVKLGTKFGSWGSAGDKDGNSNVTAETTLEAIALHTQAILTRYRDEMKTISQLDEWEEKFNGILTELTPITEGISSLRKTSEAVRKGTNKDTTAEMLNQEFDELSAKLAALRTRLDAKAFEAALKTSYDNSPDNNVLNLLRRFRTFGFNFSKIEYRETAGEYSRVVEELIPGYKALNPKDRAQKLSELLTHGDPASLLKTLEKKIASEGAAQKYGPESAMPIAYHTLKRMALARDFPGMIKDNVLAECGKLDKENATDEDITYQGVSNLLEAQFLQRASAKDDKRPLLGIIPLFEEPETMKHIDQIMGAAYENAAYKNHMQLLQQQNHTDMPVQQVQIAHSDNARRSGLPAARGFIHDAHEKIRALNEKHGVRTQFFEGGSMSDPYRNGVRAVSGIVNDFNLHDFAKFTFQGGDMLSYLNDPRSIERLFTRNISHQADYLGSNKRVKPADKFNAAAEWVARDALQATLPDYERQDFQTGTMGLLLSLLGYKNEVKDGGRGSRAAQRIGDAKPQPNEAKDGGKASHAGQHTGNNKDKQNGYYLQPIDIIKGVRTIGFSEALQHNGLVPTWVGAFALNNHLKTAIKLIEEKATKTPEEETFLKEMGPVAPGKEGQLTPKQLKYLYTHSPTFKDSQDRAAFGHAQTDMNAFEAIVNQKLIDIAAEKKDADFARRNMPKKNRDPRLPITTPKQTGEILGYLRQLKEDFKTTARIAYGALTGNELNANSAQSMDEHGHGSREIPYSSAGEEISNISYMMATDALPHLKDDILNKRGYRDFLLNLKLDNTLDDHLRALAHAAGDTVMHGRWLAADDPSYGKHFHKHKMEQQLVLN